MPPKDRPPQPTSSKRPAGKATYHGSVPASDPRYQSGWNFLSGKNLAQLRGGEPTSPIETTRATPKPKRDAPK
jgi:hypothetical protein